MRNNKGQYKSKSIIEDIARTTDEALTFFTRKTLIPHVYYICITPYVLT
jgi:hypothetical protein